MRTDDLTDKIADPVWATLLSEWINFIGFWFKLITGFYIHRCEFRFERLEYHKDRIITKCSKCGALGHR